MSGNKASEADDVFEFLDSLPSKTGKESNESMDTVIVEKGKKDEDILGFLDELEKSNLDISKKDGKKQVKQEKLSNVPIDDDIVKPLPKKKEQPPKEDSPKKTVKHETVEQEEPSQLEESLNDPITSISNWWSSSGSTTVTNIWNKTQEQATQLKERIQQDQITKELTSKINTSKIQELANTLQKIVVGETEEVLRIHLVHDLINYPLLQYHVEQKFHDVLNNQVQGGIRIFVDEWSNPNEANKNIDSSNKRQLNIFNGKIIDGEKLAFANLDNAIKLFNKAHDEIVKQQKEARANEGDDEEEEEDESRISDLFISILPISVGNIVDKDESIHTTDAVHPGNFSFTIILKDISNKVTTITRSQGFPIKWANWLEGSVELKTKDDAITDAKKKNEKADDDKDQESDEDEEEVDPSEWVKEWIEDGLSLTFGVVAQNYVIERMGF